MCLALRLLRDLGKYANALQNFQMFDVELNEFNCKNHLFRQLQPGELIWVLISQIKHTFHLSICKVSIIIYCFQYHYTAYCYVSHILLGNS